MLTSPPDDWATACGTCLLKVLHMTLKIE